jgi:hypothetical protein
MASSSPTGENQKRGITADATRNMNATAQLAFYGKGTFLVHDLTPVDA